MNWIIIGAGYTGQRLARELAGRGQDVVLTRRSAEVARQMAESIGGRVSGAGVVLDDLPALEATLSAGAIVVDCAPPGPLRGAERSLVEACARARARRLVYLSSTGVYPRGGGMSAPVTEQTPAVPLGGRGVRRLEAESEILDRARELGLEAISLRVAGIYGPGRGVAARIAAGDYRVIGSGAAVVSRIHVDDLVAAIIAAGTVEPLPFEVVNVADDAPTSSRFLADQVAAMLGVPPPPSVDPASVGEEVRAMLGADRNICNERLKQLGVTLRYPSWREGMAAVIAESRV